MQTPPPNYQPGGWQQQQQPPMYQPGGGPPGPPRTQTLNLEYNVAAGLCYIPVFFIGLILSIVFLASEPKSNRFVRFHAMQALCLLLSFPVFGVIGYVLVILAGVLTVALTAATQSGAGAVIGLVLMAGAGLLLGGSMIFLFVVLVIALIKAFTGKEWRAPIIGSLAERFV